MILPDEQEDCGAITTNESQICDYCQKAIMRDALKIIAEFTDDTHEPTLEARLARRALSGAYPIVDTL
jgi:hypothetical protein